MYFFFACFFSFFVFFAFFPLFFFFFFCFFFFAFFLLFFFAPFFFFLFFFLFFFFFVLFFAFFFFAFFGVFFWAWFFFALFYCFFCGFSFFCFLFWRFFVKKVVFFRLFLLYFLRSFVLYLFAFFLSFPARVEKHAGIVPAPKKLSGGRGVVRRPGSPENAGGKGPRLDSPPARPGDHILDHACTSVGHGGPGQQRKKTVRARNGAFSTDCVTVPTMPIVYIHTCKRFFDHCVFWLPIQ